MIAFIFFYTMQASVTMNNGLSIPSLGFGTWQAPEGETATNSVIAALEAGYRHIDTAAIYGNERSVGQALQQSSVPREEIFVTTKVWNTMRGKEKTLLAFEESMEKLQLDYLDLYLVHWPANAEHYPEDWKAVNASTWEAMEEILASGRVRAIGVSNFMPEHLTALMETAKVTPCINQIEYHPGYMQQETVDLCQQLGIAVEAWSPLGCGGLITNPLLLSIAEKYGKSVAQICIRWCLQNKTIPLPKSATPSRITENAQVWDFELSEEDMRTLNEMPTTAFSGSDPRVVNFM